VAVLCLCKFVRISKRESKNEVIWINFYQKKLQGHHLLHKFIVNSLL
jgi:hypothetical protein